MAAARDQQQTLNTKPLFASAGDYEMRDYYAAQDASRPPSQQSEPYLTPYLGLRARLSQTCEYCGNTILPPYTLISP